MIKQAFDMADFAVDFATERCGPIHVVLQIGLNLNVAAMLSNRAGL